MHIQPSTLIRNDSLKRWTLNGWKCLCIHSCKLQKESHAYGSKAPSRFIQSRRNSLRIVVIINIRLETNNNFNQENANLVIGKNQVIFLTSKNYSLTHQYTHVRSKYKEDRKESTISVSHSHDTGRIRLQPKDVFCTLIEN